MCYSFLQIGIYLHHCLQYQTRYCSLKEAVLCCCSVFTLLDKRLKSSALREKLCENPIHLCKRKVSYRYINNWMLTQKSMSFCMYLSALFFSAVQLHELQVAWHVVRGSWYAKGSPARSRAFGEITSVCFWEAGCREGSMVLLVSAYQSMLFEMPAHIKWLREARRKISDKRDTDSF